MEVSLYNSTVCRLCGEENDNGTFLYSSEENNQNLSELINTYLPIKVSDDGQLPRTICPGCTIQLEANVEFLTLIINGQKVIRQLHEREKDYKKTISANSTNENQIVTETVIYEKTGDTIYPDDHPISLQVGGLAKPKRKRGRPPKKNKPPEENVQEPTKSQEENEVQKDSNEETNGKRRRKTPTRFKEVIQGKELERIFIEEGVTDGDESEDEPKSDIIPDVVPETPKEPEVIGHMEKSGELVVVVKGKGRGRPKGRLRQIMSRCAICGLEFTCVGRYMSHVAGHGPVLYQCTECQCSFPTRILFTRHQDETEHTGQNVIPCADTANNQQNAVKVITPKKEVDPLAPISEIVKNVNITNITRSLPDLNPVKLDIDEMPNALKSEQVDCSTSKENAIPNELNDEDADLVVGDEASGDGKEKNKLKCHNCDKYFSSKQSRSLHNKAIHQGEKPYICGECGAKFAYPRSLTLHMLSHRRRHNAKGYACDLCGKVLNHPSSVVYHKEAEHAGQRYVCSKCNKSFKHKQLLQRHQLVHSQLRPYSCKTCNASFKTKANLVNHTLLHTGVKKFSCEICKHKFAHKTSLTLHMRWHTGQKPFSCGKCGKSFSQKGNLSEHERIHTGEKPYECAVCQRRFTTSSQHRLHARRHHTDRPYGCSTCGKRFVSRASWVAHSRREAGGGAAHACPVCARAFNERWALRKHMRRHTGERPHACTLCHKAFADASNLNKHKKQVHKQISLLVKDLAPGASIPMLPPAPAPPLPAVSLPQEPATAAESDSEEERVIYVAYDVSEDVPAYHILQAEQAVSGVAVEHHHLQLQNLQESAETSEPEQLPVTDEDGNPLHFTMEDGTQLAITLADGKSLQIVTQDGQTIPVEINRYNEEVEEEVDNTETIMEQIDIKKSAEENEVPPVTHFFTIV